MGAFQVISFVLLIGSSSPHREAQPPADCKEWHECRQMALEAFERRDYERFHDLAWRAVQTGPRRDPNLMYLLARAQSLSGRLDDALVMLRRVAEMGVASDAVSNDEFQGVRSLPGWPDVEALIAGALARPAAGLTMPATSRSVAATAPAAKVPPSSSDGATPAVVPSVSDKRSSTRPESVLNLPGRLLNSTGLAYDDVSSRFVVGERGARKLLVVDQRSQHVLNLVDSSSAGFYEIMAFEIDPRRGDLWVVSADGSDAGGDAGRASSLHKLQLVSGRPLQRLSLPDQFLPARFSDVAITERGTVFVLDSIGKRIFRVGAGQRTFEVAATLRLETPVTIGPINDSMVYVAHAKGIARVDLATGKATPVGGPKDVPLTGFERLRADQNTIVGIQTQDGRRRAVRVRLAASGGRAQSLELFDENLAMPDPTAATLSGDTLYVLTEQPSAGGAAAGSSFQKIRLR